MYSSLLTKLAKTSENSSDTALANYKCHAFNKICVKEMLKFTSFAMTTITAYRAEEYFMIFIFQVQED